MTKALRADGVRLLEVKTLADSVDYPPYERTRRVCSEMGFVHLETTARLPAGVQASTARS